MMNLNIVLLWITLVILGIAAVAASIYASYLLGLNQMKSRWLVEAKRREKRLLNEARLWQNVYVKAKGGSLKEQPPRETEQKVGRKIVSASEVVAELRQPKILTPSVPKQIESEFLENVKPYVSTNTDKQPSNGR